MFKRCLPVVVPLLLLVSGCKEAPQPVHEDVRPVLTVVTRMEEVRGTATYSGEVRSRNEVQLAFRQPGKVVARFVDMGARVRKGQKLLQLDATQDQLQQVAAQADVDAARHRVEQARVDIERTQKLLARQYASQAELDQQTLLLEQATSQLKAATARQQQSAHQGNYSTLTAERDGTVTFVGAEVGQVVSAGQRLVTVAADGEREVVISVPESRIDELRRAKDFQITVWARPGVTWNGRLRELSPDADPLTRTYSARITLIENPAEPPVLGMTASVQAVTSAGSPGIQIPLAAVVERPSGQEVWVVDTKSSTVVARKVDVGDVHRDSITISKGLAAGETVVVAGAHRLRNGQRVKLAGEPGAAGEKP